MIWVFWGFVLGAVLGSYFSAALWRRSAGIGLGGRSFCPACKEEIPARWNIPILSWLLLRGRARCCGAKLAKRDILWEVGGASFGALLGGIFGPVALILFLIFTVLISVLIQ